MRHFKIAIRFLWYLPFGQSKCEIENGNDFMIQSSSISGTLWYEGFPIPGK